MRPACGYCVVFKDRGEAKRRPCGHQMRTSPFRDAAMPTEGAGLSKLNSMLGSLVVSLGIPQ